MKHKHTSSSLFGSKMAIASRPLSVCSKTVPKCGRQAQQVDDNGTPDKLRKLRELGAPLAALSDDRGGSVGLETRNLEQQQFVVVELYRSGLEG
jgi:hypothetical protein